LSGVIVRYRDGTWI